MAKLLEYSLELPEFDWQQGVSFDQTEHGKAFEALMEVSNNLTEGEIKGGVVSFGVADGQAHYLVVKERPLTLQHIYFLDGYQVHYALIKGLDRADIEAQLAADRRLNALFAKAKTEA